MRIAVMGSGAVGGYFGAKLAAAGHQVAFIARGQHLEALKANGLIVARLEGNLTITNAQWSDNPAKIGVVDVILFCVKSYDTEKAAEQIRPMVGTRTLILSLQNGIDNPATLGRFYQPEQILPAVVYIGAQLIAPGRIAHANGGRIIFGQFAGAINTASQALQQTLNAATIPCEISATIEQVQWTKLLWNAPFCAISCLARANVKAIVDSASLTALAFDCMAEVQGAARTRAIELRRQQFDEVMAFSRGLGEFKPSMLQDLEAGKPLEYEAFNGIVVRLLRAAGASAPVNQVFYQTLQFLDQQIRGQPKT
jgi:2-dehydropantoate 2-reductase